MKDILKPKSQQEIWDDIARLHPVDQFCAKFSYFYRQDPDPNRIMELISRCEPPRELSWTITSTRTEMEIPYRHERIAYADPRDPTFSLHIEHTTTFDTYHRTIELRYGQMQITDARDSISIRANETFLPNLDP